MQFLPKLLFCISGLEFLSGGNPHAKSNTFALPSVGIPPFIFSQLSGRLLLTFELSRSWRAFSIRTFRYLNPGAAFIIRHPLLKRSVFLILFQRFFFRNAGRLILFRLCLFAPSARHTANAFVARSPFIIFS